MHLAPSPPPSNSGEQIPEFRGILPLSSGEPPSVELGGIEPPSARWLAHPLRPFPTLPLTAVAPAGRLTEVNCRVYSPTSAVFAGCQRSFPAVHPHFCCRAVRIRPRAPFLVTMTLHYLTRSGGESELLIGGSFGVPVYRV